MIQSFRTNVSGQSVRCATLHLLVLLWSATCFATDGIRAAVEASESGNVEALQRLLASGVGVDARDETVVGGTLLMHAASGKSIQVIDLLIARGADVKARSNLGQTPLHFAAFVGTKEIVSRLLELGADVDARDHDGRTPLFFNVLSSAANGASTMPLSPRELRHIFARPEPERIAEAGILLAHGASVQTGTKDASLVYIASSTGDAPLVAVLIAHGASLDEVRTGETALHSAIAERHLDVARLLIEKGANVNARNRSGRTPLHFVAALVDDPDLAGLLIQHGADVNARESKFNATPLFFAAEKRNPRVADILRRHGGID